MQLEQLGLTDAQLRAVSVLLNEQQAKHNAELIRVRAAVKREADKLELITDNPSAHRLCDRIRSI